MSKQYYIYILFNKPSGTLYTGVTSVLKKRIIEHKLKKHPESFTAKYDVDKLGYYETFQAVNEAIDREKQIKSWSRKKKIQLIKSTNPNWMDLFEFL